MAISGQRQYGAGCISYLIVGTTAANITNINVSDLVPKQVRNGCGALITGAEGYNGWVVCNRLCAGMVTAASAHRWRPPRLSPGLLFTLQFCVKINDTSGHSAKDNVVACRLDDGRAGPPVSRLSAVKKIVSLGDSVTLFADRMRLRACPRQVAKETLAGSHAVIATNPIGLTRSSEDGACRLRGACVSRECGELPSAGGHWSFRNTAASTHQLVGGKISLLQTRPGNGCGGPAISSHRSEQVRCPDSGVGSHGVTSPGPSGFNPAQAGVAFTIRFRQVCA